jgi:hypothetical protein
MSPMLFALFIDDLLRELDAADGGLVMTGSRARGRRVTCIAYADDIALLASSPAALQRLLDIVSRWVSDWGMAINPAVGKTEVMVVLPTGVAFDAATHLPVGGVWTVTGAAGNVVAVNVTGEYDYLGCVITPYLDPERPLRRRTPAAHLAALRLRQLPRGVVPLSQRQFTQVYNSQVLSHLTYAASVFAPPAASSAGLYDTPYLSRWPASERPPEDRGKECPYVRAILLHRWMAEESLARRGSGSTGNLAMSTALLHAETGWKPLQTTWDTARLRLLGDILVAGEANPMHAVATAQLAAPAPGNRPPFWNWVLNTRELLSRLPASRAEGGRAPANPSALVDWARLRLAEAMPVSTWRASVRAALCAPHGRDAAAFATRLRQPGRSVVEAYPWLPDGLPRVPESGAPPPGSEHALRPPATATTHTVAMWLYDACGAAAWLGSGGAYTPVYRLFFGSSPASRARLALRTSSRSFTGSAEGAEPAFLWGMRRCPACAAGLEAHGAPALVPVLDAWHRITECPALDGARVAALHAAAGLVLALPDAKLYPHAVTFADIVTARHTAAGRVFVFLAALGATLSMTASPPRGLPLAWAELLAAPSARTRRATERQRCISVAATLPAFEDFVRLVASPCDPGPNGPPPVMVGEP